MRGAQNGVTLLFPITSIETTFAEMRSCLGLESTHGWCARTVLRAAPSLFGLYSAVAVLYRALPESERSATVTWPGKSGVTFSDALAAVRRWLWSEWVLPRAGAGTLLEKLPGPLHEVLLAALAPA
jgi:hypothetical protein